MNSTFDPLLISRFRKLTFLRKLSEDDFRDRVVRPLLLRMGFEDGRDLCGPNEAGRDALFTEKNRLGDVDIYVVQTKAGNLTLAREPAKNVVQAATQIRTAMGVSVLLLSPKQKRCANKAILCASGKINDAARGYILEELKNPNIYFMDADELIPKIDEYYKELWYDIDANLFPYVRAMKRSIENETQLFTRGDLIAADLPPVASSTESFVEVHAYRRGLQSKRHKGVVHQVPDIEDFPVTGFLNRKEPLVLLWGSAGSGKSTALLRMAYVLCEKAESGTGKSRVPVFIRALEVQAAGSRSLLELCLARCTEIAGTGESPVSTTDLEAGGMYVFIDALDELADTEAKNVILDKTREFIRSYPKCRVLVASRRLMSLAESGALNGFAQFDLAPISYRQAKKILVRLQKRESLPVQKATDLLRRIQEVHGLELNPLMVTIFAATSDFARRDIPANITELFKKFTEHMLGRWDSNKGLSLQYQAPLKDFVLTRIGYELHRRRDTTILLTDLKKQIGQDLSSRGYNADAERLTEEIVTRSALFRIVGDRVEFRHLLLQEFFAGRGIPDPAAVHTYIGDEWWRRALVFFFGDRPNEHILLQEVIGRLEGASAPRKYNAAVAIGLAVQASYLVEVKEKLSLVEWVIRALADSFQDFQRDVVGSSSFPLRDFLGYYLFARDAVAMCALKDACEALRQKLVPRGAEATQEGEMRRFWLIVGLMESGNVEGAEREIRGFVPKDRRMLLALHLGAFLIQHLGVATAEDVASARRICDLVAPYFEAFRSQLLDEFKSELLEVQKGEIVALPAPTEDCLASKLGGD